MSYIYRGVHLVVGTGNGSLKAFLFSSSLLGRIFSTLRFRYAIWNNGLTGFVLIVLLFRRRMFSQRGTELPITRLCFNSVLSLSSVIRVHDLIQFVVRNWESENFDLSFSVEFVVPIVLISFHRFTWQRQVGFWKSDTVPNGFGEYYHEFRRS